MDSNGKIYLDPTEEEVKRKKLVKIPKEHAEATINMNRTQRRAWYRAEAKRQRKALK